MKKWITGFTILAVLLLASIGGNIYQFISSQQASDEIAAPQNSHNLNVPDLPNNYFIIVFDEKMLGSSFGPVKCYDKDGNEVFEFVLKSTPSRDDEPVWVEYENYVYGYGWSAFYIEEPLEIVNIKLGEKTYYTGDLVLAAHHAYCFGDDGFLVDISYIYYA